jgi:hypothetical protein
MDYRQYFYFIGITILVPVWIYLFLKRERRKDMILFGTLLGIGAVIIDHMYAKFDYWNPVFIFPDFPFEDFYYGFIFGGISTELYEAVFHKRNSLRKVYATHKKLLVIMALVTALSFWLSVDVLKLNSIIAHVIPPIMAGIAVTLIRKDLLIPEILNALLVTGLTFVMFKILLFIYPDIFINHWYLENLSNIYISQIPIEELLFAFAVGFGMGSLYELVYGYSQLPEEPLGPFRQKRNSKKKVMPLYE